MLRVERAVVRFGATTAVDELDLAVGAGETVAILGPSGCGKTTLLRAIAGLQALDSGRIGISGQALGIAQAALDEAREMLLDQGHEEGDDFVLADMATRIDSARLLAYHAAWLCGRGRPFTRQASMAKLLSVLVIGSIEP